MTEQPPWTTEPFADALPRLLEERSMSLRALSRMAGVEHSHLSRAARGDGRVFSGELVRRLTEALGLPPGHFPEDRTAKAVKLVASDASLRDELYREAVRREQRP